MQLPLKPVYGTNLLYKKNKKCGLWRVSCRFVTTDIMNTVLLLNYVNAYLKGNTTFHRQTTIPWPHKIVRRTSQGGACYTLRVAEMYSREQRRRCSARHSDDSQAKRGGARRKIHPPNQRQLKRGRWEGRTRVRMMKKEDELSLIISATLRVVKHQQTSKSVYQFQYICNYV